MSKVILHIDLNYFFVRCEEIKNPSLIGKPVMIGSDGRSGIVSTCSYNARKYGVKSGQPGYIAKKLCPNIIMIPGDYHYYELMSNEFFHYVKTFTHKIETFSIDECYADFTDLIKVDTDINKLLKEFQKGLIKKTKLYCSIGVGTTKFIAKMASDFKKPLGITIIRNKDIKKKLFPLDISSFYGIGKKSVPKFKSINVNTIEDLYNFAKNKLDEDNNDEYYKYIIDALTGKTDDSIIPFNELDSKSIGNSITLDYDTDDIEIILKKIKEISDVLEQRIKNENKLSRTIQIVVKDTSFKVFNKSKTIDNPIYKSSNIFNIASNLYKTYFMDKKIRLIGITLQNLINKSDYKEELTLFNIDNLIDKETNIMEKINKKLNKKLIIKAKDLINKR